MTHEIEYHLLEAGNARHLEGAEVFDNRVDPPELAAFLADPGHMLVFATQAGRVVGFASGAILRHPDKPPSLFVNEVSVAEDMRRRGIATELCQRLLAEARGRRLRGIWLATEDHNTAARALYRGLEARETAGIVVYDWEGAMDG